MDYFGIFNDILNLGELEIGGNLAMAAMSRDTGRNTTISYDCIYSIN